MEEEERLETFNRDFIVGTKSKARVKDENESGRTVLESVNKGWVS